MIWAIGEPGAAVRIYVEGNSFDRAAQQADASEIVVEVNARLPFAVIAADGSGIIEGLPPENWETDRIRMRRTALLSACDWTQMPDAPLSSDVKEAWRLYRQALRDLPTSQPDATLETVEWPSPPENG